MTEATTPELDVDPDETIDLLQQMVRIPSPYFEEHALAEFVYEWLDPARAASRTANSTGRVPAT